ncbi:putative RNA recognition motif domain, mei2-like RNA recognition, RNA-binding domain superfamily [Dioscorea sansibarensis]
MRRRMPSEVMDQRPLSFFSEEIRFPAERQFGFWKPESMPDHCGAGGMPLMSGSKSVCSSPFEKIRNMGSNSVECSELAKPNFLKDQRTEFVLDQNVVGLEGIEGKPLTLWKATENSRPQSGLYVEPRTGSLEGIKLDFHRDRYENGLFSSSLSEIFNKNLTLSSNGYCRQHAFIVDSNVGADEPFESLEEIEAQTIGNLLPDDDDLLSGVIDDLDQIGRSNSGDDIEDDLFYSGGGMELEADGNFIYKNHSHFINGADFAVQLGELNNLFAGEHPHGEHPSRTLFVRNISSNVEDSELKDLFEQYGDVRAIYTACKHRGFVMISYYDIRSARNAMRALQSKPLRRRKLDIHFSIPKENPSEKDINQGTVVAFDLDSSVSDDDLRQIFGVYGEIKEIREIPHKQHHRFIEFYDVRAAETALRASNRSDIPGKNIKLELSFPGGASVMQQQSYTDLELEEPIGWQGSPANNSPSKLHVSSGAISLGAITTSGLDNAALQVLRSAVHTPVTTYMDTAFNGISSRVPHNLSSPVRVTSAGNHGNPSVRVNPSHSLGQMNFPFPGVPTFAHSLPEYHEGLSNGTPCNSSSNISAMPVDINSICAGGVDKRHIQRIASGGPNNHSFEHNGAAFGRLGNGSHPLHGHQFCINNSNSYQHHASDSMMWQSSPSFNGIPAQYQQHMHGLPRPPTPVVNTGLSVNHHVGSAPAINPSIWDRRHIYTGESVEPSAFHPGSLGSLGFSGGSLLHPLELASHSIFAHSNGNHIDPSIGSAHGGIPSPQQRCLTFHGRNSMMPSSFDAPSDRVRSRRADANVNQTDNKKQYELDIDRIVRGEDSRTTLMIKNIPNKYTSKMLLATIDENHRGTYDFIYLPIDFKNKCNVGYAFINMIDPQRIIPFYQAFNGKKWEKFNSEKVASLAYARIQGKAALIAHFQNSSLMNEDKRCRPILFHSDGPNAGDQEPFPVGTNVRPRPGRSRTCNNEENLQGSPSSSANGEETPNGKDSA